MEIAICSAILILSVGFTLSRFLRVYGKVEQKNTSVEVSKEFYDAAMEVHHAFCLSKSVSEKNAKLPSAVINLDRAIIKMNQQTVSDNLKQSSTAECYSK